MEDTHLAWPQFRSPTESLYAVFDGHGGKTVAQFCQTQFPQYFTQALKQASPDQALVSTFHRLDQQTQRQNLDSGSTAIVAYIDGQDLWVAGAGDSRAIIVSANGETSQLSTDHKATSPQEQHRIETDGGIIANRRVGGRLAISRAIGDHQLGLDQWIIPTPEIQHHRIKSSHQFLVLACDGLWDVMDNQEVARAVDRLASKGKSSQEIAQELTKYAFNRKSTDNVTAVVVDLRTRPSP